MSARVKKAKKAFTLIETLIATVIIAPMTTKSRTYPTRVEVTFKRKSVWIVLDQIRTVDKRRLIRKLGTITGPAILNVKATLSEMLIE